MRFGRRIRGKIEVKVPCKIWAIDIEGDFRSFPGLEAICNRCGNRTESGGDDVVSAKRCLVQMKETCPYGESNWYESEGEVYEDFPSRME